MAISESSWEHDIFLSYNRDDAVVVERLAAALRDRDLRVFKDDWYLRPGEFWPCALERKLHNCAAIVVAIGGHGLGPWQQREVVAALSRQDQARKNGERVPPVVPVLLEQASNKQAGLSFLMQNVWVEAWDPRAADQIKGALDDKPPVELRQSCHFDPRKSICPYRGLQVFREEDAAFYFGRELDVEALLSAVMRHPVAAVIGPSGSGKSSLVRAGLFPKLLKADGGPIWQRAAMTPGRDPFRALADRLLPLREPERYLGWSRREIDVECDDLTMRLERDGADHLARVVMQILEQEPGTTNLVLLIDQWEELYLDQPIRSTTKTDRADRSRRFVDMLVKAVQDAPMQFVFTLRADYWGEALNDPRLMMALYKDATVHLSSLDRSALERAIRKPAQQVGLHVEDALVDALLNDAAGEPGDLPLVEFALLQIFTLCSQAGSGFLTFDAYRKLGGISEAIVKQADKLVDRLDQNERAAVPGLFTALVQVGEQRSDLRRRARFAELTKAARTVARRFADARLLVTSRDFRNGEELVEVAHEALLRHWPKLKEWVASRRDALLTIRQLQSDCAGWLARGKPKGYVWSHERAREAAAAFAELGDELVLSSDERAFLGPIDPRDMLAELTRLETDHHRRLHIGQRLDVIGDPRKGIGLSEEGVPEFDWQLIPGGEATVSILTSFNDFKSPVAKRLMERRGPFVISRYPVTVTQYVAFINAEDGWRNSHWWADDLHRDPQGDAYQFGQFGNHAVVYVSWFDAMAFCRWLSSRLDKPISLPDEWQWQLAAGGCDSNMVYPWGDDWDPDLEHFRGNCFESRLGAATAVGMYPAGASRYNVLDLSGTVWEWTLNKFEDPLITASSEFDFDQRTLRGGSWINLKFNSRCANRFRLGANHFRSFDVGFRVVSSFPV